GFTYTTTSNHIAGTAVAGTYSVIAVKDDTNDITGTYTVELTGAGAGMPENGKQDGGRCIPCEEAAKARAAGVQVAAESPPVTDVGQTNGGSDPINIATGN